ncbi:hypothetical protein [Pelagibacterium lentulum]|uniref:Uncharacterized protein n=1 Tax=Pelagibacterium lentulum TaxID=2029865 RepID=A0A916R772_9HYPH|nr:hypothetical protein [Pelagibacterium lentulum]GGA42598.1 hypothetical protein GCM10011499_10170 [Pelagibacterium lentulum]
MSDYCIAKHIGRDAADISDFIAEAAKRYGEIKNRSTWERLEDRAPTFLAGDQID